MSTLQTPSIPTGEERELVLQNSPLAPFISVNLGRMHGEPCFSGSRVLLQHLFDHLRAGESLNEFLEGFPTVSRQQAVAVIDLAARGLIEGLRQL